MAVVRRKRGQTIATGEFQGEFKPDKFSDAMNPGVVAPSSRSVRIVADPLTDTRNADIGVSFPYDPGKSLPSGRTSLDSVQLREFALSDPVGMSFGIAMQVEGIDVFGVVDSAAQITVLSSRIGKRLHLEDRLSEEVRLRNAQKNSFLTGYLVKDVSLFISGHAYTWDVIVADIADDLLLGLDFLRAEKAKIDLAQDSIALNGVECPAVLKRDPGGNHFFVSRVFLDKRVVVPPGSVVVVSARVQCPFQSAALFTPVVADVNLLPAFLLVSCQDGCVPVNLVNVSSHNVTLRAGTLLGQVEEVGHVSATDNPGDVADSVVAEDVNCRGNTASISVAAGSSRPRGSVSADSVAAEDAKIRQLSVDADSGERSTASVPSHLENLFQSSKSGLSSEQSDELARLLSEFGDIFAQHDLDLGEFQEIQHRIRTVDERPVQLRMRRTPLGFEKEEEKHLKSMLEAGVIEESVSDWCAAPVLIRKKDGTVRYCLDYRKLNAKTVKDAFPLPLIEECMDTLSGNIFFSTLDMAAGYWQIVVHPDDRHKSAFITKYGLFQHVRMPFGLCNAPATFSRAMDLVLRGLNWRTVLAYLDDVIVLGKTFPEHMSNLREVFERFRKHGLKLKPRKCCLCQTQVEFLGHLVDSDGLHITESKSRAVKDWPTPTSRVELESFLGFVNYHRNFMKDFAGVAAPLYQLTGSKASFIWTDECDQAFHALKDLFLSAPVLALPNASDTFILDTDASHHSIGASLSQVQSGEEKTISFASLMLPAERRRYCVTRKELLAVVMFTRQFRHYLLGRQFVVRTDHSSLVWLMRFKQPEGQLARWLEELSQYDMVIEHRPGAKHLNADGLSRIPVPCSTSARQFCSPEELPCGGCTFCVRAHQRWTRFEEDVDYVVPLVVRAVKSSHSVMAPSGRNNQLSLRAVAAAPSQDPGLDDSSLEDQDEAMEFLTLSGTHWLGGYTAEELRDFQLRDASLAPIVGWLESKVDPQVTELARTSPATRQLWLCRSQLKLKGGVLFYRWVQGSRDRLKFVVPDSLKSEVLTMVHDSKVGGHVGEDRTLLRLKSSFYWHGSKVDCKAYVRSCAVCSQNKKPNRRPKAALGAYLVGGRNERVHLDLLGPFPKSKSGNRYVLMIVDQFTKWFECVAIPDQSAEVMAKAFVDQYIARFGPPLEIHTDQGGCFTGDLFQACCSLLDVAKTRTTPYRPRSNGQVERYNRVLLPMIRSYLRGGQSGWDEHLQLLAMAIRATVNRSTGFTANMLMLGEEVRTPIDIMLGVADANRQGKEPAAFVLWLRRILGEVHQEARELLEASQRRQKRAYDLKLFQRKYSRGDLVWVIDDSTKVGRSSKLHPPWKGPFLIVEVLSPVLFRVQERRRCCVIHHDKLKLCRDRSIPFWLRRKRHELLQLDSTLPNSQDGLDPGTPLAPFPGVNVVPVVAGAPGGTPITQGAAGNAVAAGPPASDLDETLPYGDDDPATDLEETIPYEEEETLPHGDDDLLTDMLDAYLDDGIEDAPVQSSRAVPRDEDLGDFCLDSLFAEPPSSRSGRVVRTPAYLHDYVS